jgi:hypothetical protein
MDRDFVIETFLNVQETLCSRCRRGRVPASELAAAVRVSAQVTCDERGGGVCGTQHGLFARKKQLPH